MVDVGFDPNRTLVFGVELPQKAYPAMTGDVLWTRLEQFDYAGATAIAVVMLVASFLIIFAVNRIQRWAQTRIPAH